GPPRGPVAEVFRGLVQGGQEDRSGVVGPVRGPAGAVMSDQGTGHGVVPVGIDPTVDRATTDSEPEGYIGDGVPPVEIEQTEGATIGAEVVGRPQLTAETKPLLGCQP